MPCTRSFSVSFKETAIRHQGYKQCVSNTHWVMACLYPPGGRYAKLNARPHSSLLRPAISKHRNTGSQTWCNSTEFPPPGPRPATAYNTHPHARPLYMAEIFMSCTKSWIAQGQRSARSWSRFLWNFQGWHNFPYLRGSCAAHAMCMTWFWFARDNVHDMNISEDPQMPWLR